jgi:hypothetical protein
MRLFLGLSILLALYPLACRAESCANGVQATGGPNEESIELSGVLHRQVRWGPPNYGENPKTDSTFIAWIISLREPLVIQGGVQIGDKSQNSSVSEIALISYSYKVVFDTERLQSLDGKLVVVTGKLWPATTSELTPIILLTKMIKPTDQNICRVIPGN